MIARRNLPLLLALLVLHALTGCGGSSRGTIGGGELVPLPDGRVAPRDIHVPDAGAGADVVRSDGAPSDTWTPPSDVPQDVPEPADVPAADVPAADVPTDDVPAADVPVADVPVADVPVGEDVPADVPVVPDVPVPPVRLWAATWNVHFYWDDVCHSGSCGTGDFEEELTPAEFDARADGIAAAIRGLEADVVCLQEVESQRGLDWVATRLLPDFPIAVMGESGWASSLDVAVVARGTLDEVRRHRSTPIPLPSGGTTRFARELLEVHLHIDGAPVVFFCAHFKSQHDDDAELRLAEAMATYDIVTATAAERPDALVVLAGDLNDTPGSPPLDALEESGKLLRVASELPGDEAGTYWFDGPNALDHLFQATDAGGAYVSGSATVVKDHPTYLQYGGSDHAALRAAFDR